MQPTEHSIAVNGIDLAYWEWASEPGDTATPLIFAHATGFHGRVFDAVIEHFPERRVLSLDMRGHGRTDGGPITHWSELVGDITALMERLEITGAVGIGHSMGAHSLLQAGADMPGAFSQLVLFDPVILEPQFYEPETQLFTADNPHPAIRRKRDFASPEAMIERFGSRDPYNLFERRVFEDYCRYGLIQNAEGDGMELACSPEVEASVYASSRSNRGILEAAKTVEIPALIVRAKQTGLQDFKSSPTWPQLASIMPNGTDMHRPDRTHFHPFEDSGDAARIVREAMAD